MKSEKMLESFVKFCYDNPELRFWQALLTWTQRYIEPRTDSIRTHFMHVSWDTFNWEDNRMKYVQEIRKDTPSR